jgi:hypothetical protein
MIAQPVACDRGRPVAVARRVMVALAVASLFLGMGVSTAMAMLRWSAPVQFPNVSFLSISCPSVRLCVAGTARGMVVSTDPAGGARAWQPVFAPTAPGGTSPAVYGVSCPATSFCVAAGGSAILTSTHPAGGPSGWKVARIRVARGAFLFGVSCASRSLCVAYETPRTGVIRRRAPTGGHVISSTNPTGGARAWKPAVLHDVPDAVYCVAPGLCLLGTRSGYVLTSSHPTHGARAWSAVQIESSTGRAGRGGEIDISPVACASIRYCLAAGVDSLWHTSHPTGTTPFSWPPVNSPLPSDPSFVFGPGSCVHGGFCALPASDGRVFWSPRQGAPWRSAPVGGATAAVSCVSSHFCVAVGSVGTPIADGRLVIGRG